MANELEQALLRNGFEYIGPCKICGGRGFEYQRDRAKAKLKKDQYGNEIHITLSGFDTKGKRIVQTLISKSNQIHMANLDNIFKIQLGLE